MTANDPTPHDAYRASGVDTDEADRGLHRLVERITRTWPPRGVFGGVQLDIGYFANVLDIGGGMGLALSMDGVGSKAIIAQMMNRYDTIGIDCIAMNVNDLICVGAQPLSLVDYIAVEHVDSKMLEAIGVGLAAGAEQAGISISGGEIAQLGDVVRGFDLAGTAVGTVPLDKVITGRNIEPGDRVIGIESSGIHSNGLSVARRAFFKRARPLPLDSPVPGSDALLGEELLRPTFIYVREAMEVLRQVPNVKALVNITGDGLLNLNRVETPNVGFRIDEMPETPPIFKMIQEHYPIADGEMFEVFNMGVGFCLLCAENEADAILSILKRYKRQAWVIGAIIEDKTKGVYLPRWGLKGHKKHFHKE